MRSVYTSPWLKCPEGVSLQVLDCILAPLLTNITSTYMNSFTSIHRIWLDATLARAIHIDTPPVST